MLAGITRQGMSSTIVKVAVAQAFKERGIGGTVAETTTKQAVDALKARKDKPWTNIMRLKIHAFHAYFQEGVKPLSRLWAQLLEDFAFGKI